MFRKLGVILLLIIAISSMGSVSAHQIGVGTTCHITFDIYDNSDCWNFRNLYFLSNITYDNYPIDTNIPIKFKYQWYAGGNKLHFNGLGDWSLKKAALDKALNTEGSKTDGSIELSAGLSYFWYHDTKWTKFFTVQWGDCIMAKCDTKSGKATLTVYVNGVEVSHVTS